jgi:hypothetical protein
MDLLQQGVNRSAASQVWEGLADISWRDSLPAIPDAALIEGMTQLPVVDWAGVDVWLPGDFYTAHLSGRRQMGSYYTPSTLARRIAESTIRPLFSVGAAEMFTSPELPLQFNTLRIFDPAMGSGHFLIAAGEVVAGQIGISDPTEARWAALQQLYGVDRDPAAVELAGISLWLWAALPGTQPSMLADRLWCGDVLLDPLPLEGSRSGSSFDAVIGNPPYASVFTRARRSDGGEWQSAIRARYTTATGSFDLSVPFVERAIRLCRVGGRCGLVLPNKLLAADYARALREWIAREATVEAVMDYAGMRPFAADVYPVAAIFQRTKPQPGNPLHVYRGDSLLRKGTQADLRGAPGQVWSSVFDPDWPQLRRCFGNAIPLSEAAVLAAGLTVGEAYDLRPQVIDAPPGDLPEGHVRLVTSGSIHRYQITWGQKPIRFLKQQYERPTIPLDTLPGRRREQATRQKIIVSGMGKALRAFLDDGTTQASVATTVIIPNQWPLGSLCAVLNSRLMSRLYRALFGGLALSGGYLRFGKRELSHLPIPDLPGDDPRVTALDRLALGMITPGVDGEIEALVQALYGMDGD